MTVGAPVEPDTQKWVWFDRLKLMPPLEYVPDGTYLVLLPGDAGYGAPARARMAPAVDALIRQKGRCYAPEQSEAGWGGLSFQNSV